MKHISDILKKSALSDEQVTALQITAAWPKIIGEIYPEYTAETKAEKYIRHTLTITTITSQHLMNLQMQEKQIIAKYDYYFGPGIVTAIKFKMGRL